MSLTSSNPNFLKEPITSFETVTEQFESSPIEGPVTGHPVLDEILDGYTVHEEDFHVVVPEIGFRFLESFLDRETPLMMLCGDLAYSDPEEFELESPFIFDTYFAHYSNVHIFAELFRLNGGRTQFQRHGDTNFSCGAFTMPGKGKWSEIRLNETRRDANRMLKEFCPYDAHEMSEMIEESIGEASIRQVQAWMRFSKFDPAVAEACLPAVFYQIEQGEDYVDEIQMYEMYMESYRSFFPDGSPVSLDCGIAELCMAMGYHAHALQLIKQSTAEFGPNAQRLFVHGMVMMRLGKMDEARSYVEKSLEMDTDFAPALRFMADKFSPKAEAKASDKLPYEHLRVEYTDPKVNEKAAKIFDKAGAVLIDQIISKELVQDLRHSFDKRVKDWQSTGLGKPNNVGDKRFTVPIRIQAPFDDPAVYANQALMTLLTEAMGERPVLHAFGGVVTHAGARMQHVHREHPMLFTDDKANANLPTYAVTILVPLVDLDEESGGTQFWEGTHKLPKDAEWEGDPHIAYTKAGSALVLDYRTYHGGMPCEADNGRPMLYYTYALPWFVDTMAFESHAALGLTEYERMSIPAPHRDLFKFAKKIAA